MVTERAEFTVIAGKEDEMLALLKESRSFFLGSGGCRTFAYGRGIENPSKILLLIGWDSVEAHKAITTAPGFGDFVGKLKPLLDGPSAMEHFAVE